MTKKHAQRDNIFTIGNCFLLYRSVNQITPFGYLQISIEQMFILKSVVATSKPRVQSSSHCLYNAHVIITVDLVLCIGYWSERTCALPSKQTLIRQDLGVSLTQTTAHTHCCVTSIVLCYNFALGGPSQIEVVFASFHNAHREAHTNEKEMERFRWFAFSVSIGKIQRRTYFPGLFSLYIIGIEKYTILI